jgi:hypothetical protein
MKNSIFILGFVLLITGITFSQQESKKNILERVYFKAGAEFYSLKRENPVEKGDVNNINLIGSVMYDYSDKVQLEFAYKYGFARTYSIYSNFFESGGEFIGKSKSESLADYNVDLKLNWFLNGDKTIDPLYLTGILEFDIQNKSLAEEENRSDTGWYSRQKYYNYNESSYNRLLIGPGLGAGIFFAFGKIDFQAEINSVFRVAPFVDRGYRELLLNITTGLVYKF